MAQSASSLAEGKYLFINDLQGNVSRFYNYSKHCLEFGGQILKTKTG
jgi:hypothetical protein